jgi:hypothetical protein
MINISIIIDKSYMGYFKFYYALSDFKKVVILPILMWRFTLSLNTLTISLCTLSTRFF